MTDIDLLTCGKCGCQYTDLAQGCSGLSVHDQTRLKAFNAGCRDAKAGRALNPDARPGSMWAVYYKQGYEWQMGNL